MTNNTPDYEDNLYFDCKNCKYTDEYCASGDCNKIQANDVACNKISLTEQWKKGELPEGKYWVKYKHWTDTVEMLDYSVGLFLDIDVPIDDDRIEQVLAPVPSYEVYKDLIAGRKLLREHIKDTTNENAQLKELLKECRRPVCWCVDIFKNKAELLTKINEVLK